jgi:hypothetical protein
MKVRRVTMKLNTKSPKWLGFAVTTAALVSVVGYGNTPVKAAKASAGNGVKLAQASTTETTETTTTTTTTSPADTSVSPSVTETVTIPSTESKVTATFEVRPTWTIQQGTNPGGGNSLKGKVGTENQAELGYQFNRNTIVTYRQEVNTNIYDPNAGADASGLNPVAQDGFLRGRFENLVQTDTGLSLGYEPRLYVPTDPAKRAAGMVGALRNYVKLKQNLSDTVDLSLYEVPILHLYNTAGDQTNNSANPTWENRMYLILDVAFLDGKLNFSLPLMLNTTRTRDFSVGALNNNATFWKLWAYPELTYDFTSTFTAGVAFYTDNLIGDNFRWADFGKGIEKGAAQIILRASL